MDSSGNSCDIFYVDEQKVKSVSQYLKTNNRAGDMAEIFKALCDPMRLKIIMALDREELCVCDLATLLGTSRPAVSHHLRILRYLRLVRYRRDGKIAYYSLNDSHISELIRTVQEHLDE
ncbi:MAG: helix-turn-helix transcriptional regulator [Calditrichaeota bacterium]|nr:helix-turn-helix transcriptional regulator [Calditrichota bacterium]